MAFSIVELLIVFGITVLLIALCVPLAINFFNGQDLEDAAEQLTQTLRQAQNKSMAQENDNAFGVRLTDNSYTLFKGMTYLSHDPSYASTTDLPQGITSSGLTEIIFSKLQGLPNNSGNIILTNNKNSSTININSIGRINLQ